MFSEDVNERGGLDDTEDLDPPGRLTEIQVWEDWMASLDGADRYPMAALMDDVDRHAVATLARAGFSVPWTPEIRASLVEAVAMARGRSSLLPERRHLAALMALWARTVSLATVK